MARKFEIRKNSEVTTELIDVEGTIFTDTTSAQIDYVIGGDTVELTIDSQEFYLDDIDELVNFLHAVKESFI